MIIHRYSRHYTPLQPGDVWKVVKATFAIILAVSLLALLLNALLNALVAHAAQPRTAILTVSVDSVSPATVVYQSTLLGSKWSDYRQVAGFRTPPKATTLQITPGSYRYYAVSVTINAKGAQALSQQSPITSVVFQ